MTERQAEVIRAGVRAAQVCALLSLPLCAYQISPWALVIFVPVVALLVWAWQVLYENVP